MKNFKYILGFIGIMALLIVVSSCQEDDDFGPVDIQAISDNAVYQGSPASITGAGFEQVQFVFVDSIQVSYTLDASTISFTVPDAASVGMTTVLLVMSDNRRESLEFEVLLKPVPIITKFTPFAAVGEQLTITGSSLDNSTTITIDGIDATGNIVSNDGSQLIVTVPSGVDESGPVEFEITTSFGSAIPTTAFYARSNELANSDLEAEGDGTLFAGWEVLNGADNTTAVTGAAGYGGSRSMRVVPAGGNPWDRQFASNGVPLVFGNEYTVVLWAKGESDGAQMRVSASQYDGAGADYFYGATVDLSTSWEQYTWTFTVGKDLPTHRVVLDMGMGSVPFVVDHIGLTTGAVGSSGPPELLLNGGFEDGLTSWESLNGTHDVSTAESYCGTTSMTATGAGNNPWDTQIASDPMILEVGTDYEISFWAKAAGPDGVFRISMSQYDGNGADFFYSPDIEASEDWTYYSFVTTAETTASGDYRLLFDMGATTQTFFVDGVSIKEYEAPASLYENGDLEGDLTGWESLNGTHEITTAEFYSGASSLTATGAGNNPWDTQIATDPVALTVGTDYKISFWAKAAGPDGVFRISMSQYDGNGADFFYSRDLEIPEDWTYFSFVTTAEATASGDHRLLFDMGATTQTFFVDLVSVVEYEACE